MNFEVAFSPEAQEDLGRLFDHLLAHELASPTEDLDLPQRAMTAIRQGCEFLAHSPFSCRKAGKSPFVRDLLISFGSTGDVVLFEIRDNRRVIVGAVRRQRESDYP